MNLGSIFLFRMSVSDFFLLCLLLLILQYVGEKNFCNKKVLSQNFQEYKIFLGHYFCSGCQFQSLFFFVCFYWSYNVTERKTFVSKKCYCGISVNMKQFLAHYFCSGCQFILFFFFVCFYWSYGASERQTFEMKKCYFGIFTNMKLFLGHYICSWCQFILFSFFFTSTDLMLRQRDQLLKLKFNVLSL